MEERSRKILKLVLKKLAQWTIGKYRPGVIGVTGSVGKTSTKEAIFTVMRSIRVARVNAGNFNNEIGVPLTILGDWTKVGGKLFWLKVVVASVWRLIIPHKYPEILVLEYAADRPGDIKYLLEIACPQISIVTAIGDIPVHVEFYSGPDAVAKEKAKLIDAAPTNGFIVLNFDDESVLNMRDRARARAITFGFGEGAEVRITNFENRFSNGRPEGIAFKIESGGNFVPLRIDGCLGKSQAYAAAAAACVGIAFGMNLVRIVEALHYYQPPSHRMKIVSGIKGSHVIDDAYNASPMSMHSAVEALRDVKRGRKVGILGDMLEIGKYSMQAHEAIGRLSAKTFKILITVGPGSKFIAQGANKAGMAKKDIFSFDTVEDVLPVIVKMIKKKDLILVKASRGIGLDRVVEKIRQSV